MNNAYLNLFKIPGTLKFCSAAFLGRLPAGMIGLSVILAISLLRGSYTLAGIVAAFVMISMALAAPFSGRLVDRYGQRRILIPLAIINFIGTLALIYCIHSQASLGLLCLASIFTGASRLSTGTMARTRWTYIVQSLNAQIRSQTLQTAYAFESIVDELVFITAPIIATFLCTMIHPLAGLFFCLLSYVIGALSLAAQKLTEPPITLVQKQKGSIFTIPELRIIFLATLFIGISAGAIEVIVVARANFYHMRYFIGILMAILSLSSMLSGFWYGAQEFHKSIQERWKICLGCLFLALIPFCLATNFTLLLISMFCAGLAIAPTTISGQVFAEKKLPTGLLNEGLSVIVTAMIFGMAIGSFGAGFLIDKFGPYLSGFLPVLAVFLAYIASVIFIKEKR